MRSEKIAFVLAGGGSKGAYECGALIALNKLGIKADIVTGSSSGTLVGALYCQKELKVAIKMFSSLETDHLFEIDRNANLWDFIRAFIFNKGADPKGLRDGINRYIDENKLRKSKIDFGLVTMEIPKLKGHYLWKEDIPSGFMKDYILASASPFPMVKYHKINGKKYIDGAYVDVMPVAMALDKGADTVYAIDLLGHGIEKKIDRKFKNNITIISSKWELGFPLDFDADRQKVMLKMGYLDALKALGKYVGDYYCFKRGSFKNQEELFGADCCGRFFNLSPAEVYDKNHFVAALNKSIAKYEISAEYNEQEALSMLSSVLRAESLDGIGKSDGYGKLILAVSAKMIQTGQKDFFTRGWASEVFDETCAAAKFIVDNNLYKTNKSNVGIFRKIRRIADGFRR